MIKNGEFAFDETFNKLKYLLLYCHYKLERFLHTTKCSFEI